MLKQKVAKNVAISFGYFIITKNQKGLPKVTQLLKTKEALLKGKAQYSWPPCTNSFRSASFDIANIIYYFTKQAPIIRR